MFLTAVDDRSARFAALLCIAAIAQPAKRSAAFSSRLALPGDHRLHHAHPCNSWADRLLGQHRHIYRTDPYHGGAYDVRKDILINVPDFNLALFQCLSGIQANPIGNRIFEPSHQNLVDRLIRQIEADVDPSSWQANGPGQILELQAS